MRQTSALYKTLRAAVGSWYNVRLIRGTVTYGMDRLKSVRITRALCESGGPEIGAACSAQCTVTLLERPENWPRMAAFDIAVQICSADGQQSSEWLPMGRFWTDTRSADKNGTLTIEAYDGLLLLEQTWIDRIPEDDMPESWPITAAAANTLLEEVTGLTLENSAGLDDTIPFVGFSTMSTARETWAMIAAVHGCNLQTTGTGDLRLVPLRNETAASGSIAGVAIAGIAVSGAAGGSTPLPADVAFLGLAISSLSTGDALPGITGVHLETEEGIYAEAGTSAGYVVSAECEFSDSAVAAFALNQIRGYVYRPFRADGAVLDPAAEIGDIVVVDGELYQTFLMDWTLGAGPRCDIAAEYEAEVDHEYARPKPSTKTLRKALQADQRLDESLRSTITQTAAGIMLEVSHKCGETEVNSLIDQKADSIRLKANAISWVSQNSSMTAEGVLSCTGAIISGDLQLSKQGIQALIGSAYYYEFNFVQSTFQRKSALGFYISYLVEENNRINGTDYSVIPSDTEISENIKTPGTLVKRLIFGDWDVTTGLTGEIETATRFLTRATRIDYTSRVNHWSWQIDHYGLAFFDDFNRLPSNTLDGLANYEGSNNLAQTYALLTPKNGVNLRAGDVSTGANAIIHVYPDARVSVGKTVDFSTLKLTELTEANARTFIRLGPNDTQLADYRGQAIIHIQGDDYTYIRLRRYNSREYNPSTGGYDDYEHGQFEIYCKDSILEAAPSYLRYNGLYVQLVAVSSARYKHNITDIQGGELDPARLLKLPVRQFIYNEDVPVPNKDMRGRTIPGLIAEEVEAAYPAAVIHDNEGRPETWDERRIIPAMLALIQEQQKQIDILKGEIRELRAALNI